MSSSVRTTTVVVATEVGDNYIRQDGSGLPLEEMQRRLCTTFSIHGAETQTVTQSSVHLSAELALPTMRQIISYDDITTTPQQQQQQPSPSKHEGNLAPAQPPAKRRKTTPNQRLGGPKPQQHWDDSGGQGLSMNYDDSPTITSTVTPGNGMDVEAAGVTDEHYGEEEESRELTHEEIWDDSALIEAWNSAAAEYEVRIPLSVGTWSSAKVTLTGLSWAREKLEE